MPLDLSIPFQPRNPLPVNSSFGKRPLYNDFHWGIDLNGYTNAWAGATIRAAGRGVVSQKGGSQVDVRGYWVVLDHGRDFRGDRWSTRYHILPEPYKGSVGQSIQRGEKLGVVGVSGSSATGPHLHFELLKNGIRVDPMKYLTYVGIPSPTNAPAAEGATPLPNTPTEIPTTNPEKEEDEDMAQNSGISFPRPNGAGKTITVYAIHNTASGYYSEWSGTSSAYNTEIAKTHGVSNFAPVTLGHARNIEASCAQVRTGK